MLELQITSVRLGRTAIAHVCTDGAEEGAGAEKEVGG